MHRIALLSLLFAGFAPVRVNAPAVRAAERAPGGIADLAERLTTGLRVKAPADVAFCERVAQAVREGRLPQQVVDSTYTWAIARGRKYPFPAFEHVITLQAAKLGVPL
jgi:hypothetical protein